MKMGRPTRIIFSFCSLQRVFKNNDRLWTAADPLCGTLPRHNRKQYIDKSVKVADSIERNLYCHFNLLHCPAEHKAIPIAPIFWCQQEECQIAVVDWT